MSITLNEEKIRKLLGTRFYLSTKYSEEQICEWHLYRNYIDTRVFFSKDNQEIMNSEKNTTEELYDFAKKHYIPDWNMKTRKIIVLLLLLNLISSIINIFIGSKIISIIVLTNDFDFLLIYLILSCYWNKKWKVDMLEITEETERLMNCRKS